MRFARSSKGWTLLIAASFVFIAPMALIGVYNGGDIPHHAQLAGSFENGIRTGDLYPKWGAEENAGYGGVAVRLYQPAVPFFWAALRVISDSWHTATLVLFLLFSIVGGIGVYLLAKEFAAQQFAVLTGIVFIFMPYHAFSVYGSAMYAEFAGCSLIAFSLFFITHICRGGTLTDVIGLAASFGFLVITHLPSTMTGSLVLLIYSLVLLRRANIWRSLFQLSAGAGIGLLASSFYWIKVVTERGFKNTASWQDSHFDYRLNFLLTSPWFDNRNLWFFDLVWVMLFVLGIGAFWIIRQNAEKRIEKEIYAVITVFSFSMFMSTGFSKPVWSLLPLLGEIQFPWRWLTIATATGCVLGAIAVSQSLRSQNANALKFAGGMFVVLFGLISCLMIMDYRLNFVPAANFNEFVTTQSKAVGGQWFWPVLAKENALETTTKVITGDRAVSIDRWDAAERNFTVEPGSGNTARVATFYYPYWTARINGENTAVAAGDDGAINIAVPETAATIDLKFLEPSFLKFAKWMSFFVWIAIFGFIISAFIRKSVSRPAPLTN